MPTNVQTFFEKNGMAKSSSSSPHTTR